MPACARRRPLPLVVGILLAGLTPERTVAQTPTITIVATDSLASEPPSTTTSGSTLITSPVIGPIITPTVGFGGGEFTIKLSQPSASPLTVTFDVSGAARPKIDYADIGTSVTIPAGASTFVIPVTALDDRDFERDETVIVTLRSATGYTVSSVPAAVTIVDSDFAVSLTAASQSLTEPASSTTVTVERLGTLRSTVVVRLAYAGTATRNADYTAAPDSLIIPSGQSSATFPVTVRNDNLSEATETIVVSATNFAMSPGALSITIADVSTTLTGPTSPVPEVEGGTIPFVLTRHGNLSSAATYTITLAGTATNGVDYLGIPTSVTIPSGTPSATINASIRGDLIPEPVETLQLIVNSATYPGATFTAQIAANGPLPTAVVLSVPTTPFNTEVTGTVTLLEPAVVGTTVNLVSNTTLVLLSDANGGIPYDRTIAIPATAGATSVGFRARTSSGTGSVVASITAATATASLTVSGVVTHAVGIAASPTSPVIDTTSMPSGSSRQGVVRLSASPTTISSVQLASTNAAVQVPPTLSFAASTTQMPFNIVASPVTSLQTALITATRNGLVDTLTVKVLPSVAVASVSLGAQIPSGTFHSASVQLNQAAPAGGVVVQLTSNSPNLLVPASVTVPANATGLTFTVECLAFGAASDQFADVTASAGGVLVSTRVQLIAHMVSLVLDPPPFGGQAYSFRVRLNRQAPEQGLTVTLSSSSAAFPLPPTLAFVVHDTSKTVTVQTQGVTSNTAVVITASFSGSLAKNTLTLSSAQLANVTIAPFSTFGAGATATGTITLNGAAPPGGLNVSVINANPSRAAVPSVVGFAGNASTTQFTTTALPAVDNGDAGTVSVTVALSDGQQRSTSYQALAGVVVSNFTISPTTVAAGGAVTGTVTINQNAPAGGKTFTISVLSGAGAVTVPASVTIPQGAASTSFTIATHTGTGGQAVTIGVASKTATLTITP